MTPYPDTPEGQRAMGEATRAAVFRFFGEIRRILGRDDREEIAVASLLAICAVAKASRLNLPDIMRRVLEQLAADAKKDPR